MEIRGQIPAFVREVEPLGEVVDKESRDPEVGPAAEPGAVAARGRRPVDLPVLRPVA